MSLDEESLEIAANGGSMDLEKWPGIVEPLLERLEYIIYNVFPMPAAPPEASSLQFNQQYLNPTPSFLHDPNPIPSSSNKENAAPPDLQTPPRPPPSSLLPPSSTERIPDSQPASQAAVANTTLPVPLLLILQSIQSTLRSLFTSKPPHTIQRLSELILRPNAHYRTLPAYLRALDRVVSVTSSADIFPLPMQSVAATAQPQANGTLNGTENAFIVSDTTFGSDESLGGALLTPIPWLNNASASSPGPEGSALDDASITTTASASNSAETLQNQLLTQPADPAQAAPENPTLIEGEIAAEPTEEIPTDEIPHARGPSLLGVHDMGLQDGKGVEMTLLNTAAEPGTKAEDEDQEMTIGGEAAEGQEPGQASFSQEPTESGTADATVESVIASAAAKDGKDGDGDITLSDEPTISQSAEGNK
ncbi:hypothetical protein BJY04DRAFT_188375 [Aspergillus karnatakaensis]|uniref:uncharacterized protein n=1 Tax=Aspergillus karnatakaensis TaxID=1810916 RepID=UPI003CCD9AD1